MNNPFQSYAPVIGDDFYGRDEIISAIVDNEQFSHVWIIGTRRSGKTSILKQIEYSVKHSSHHAQRYIPIFWDMHGIEDVLGLRERLIDALYVNKGHLNALGFDVMQIEELNLNTILHKLGRVFTAQNVQCLLLCDEGEALVDIAKQDDTILSELRYHIQSPWNRTVIAATGALWNLKDDKQVGYPFLSGFAPPQYALGRLTKEDALALIRKSKQSGKSTIIPSFWEEDICRLTNQIPFYIQLICMTIYEARPSTLEEAVHLAFERVDFMTILENDLSGLNFLELLILLHVVERPGISFHELEREIQIEFDIDLPNEFVKNLILLCYIEENAQNGFVVQNHFLQQWYEKHLRKIVEKRHPKVLTEVFEHIGRLHRIRGNIEQAITAYEHIVREKPDYDSYLCLGTAYLQQGDNERAIINLQCALRLNPHDVRVHLNLARAYQIQGDQAHYRESFIESFKLDPKIAFESFEYLKQKAEFEQNARYEADKKRYEVEKLREKEELQLATQQKMLSFLTHTLTNMTAGGKPTVEEIFEIVQEDLGDFYQDMEVYNLINDLAGLHTIFSVVSNMLTTYKLYIAEPSVIMKHWKADRGGTVSFEFLLALIFRQVVARLMFEARYREQFNALVGMQSTYSIKECKTAFFKRILRTELTERNAREVFDWLESYFPAVTFRIDASQINFTAQGIRFNLLFSCFAEMIYNALKYTDRRQPIQITWQHQSENFVFCCQNTFASEETMLTESQKGIAFITGFTEMITGIQFSYEHCDNLFTTQLQLQESLLIEGDVL